MYHTWQYHDKWFANTPVMSLFSQKEYKYIFSGFLSQGKCLEEGFLCLLVDKVIKIIESSSFKLLIELDMKKNLQV